MFCDNLYEQVLTQMFCDNCDKPVDGVKTTILKGEPDVGSGKNDSYVFIIIYQMSLIVFEGVDRCGKSTQIKMLANYLGNTPCEVIAFPFRESHTGKILDK